MINNMHITQSLALSCTPSGGLICIKGYYIGQLVSLINDQPFSIGRDRSLCNYIIDDSIVSRIHCKITFDSFKREYVVMDLSLNGTFINEGERLIKKKIYYLKSGTELYFGNNKMIFKLR